VSDNRPFHYAVAASLALHALALFALPDLADTARRAASIPPQIIARLMEPAPEVQKANPVPPPPVAQPEKPAAKKSVKPAPRQLEAPLAREFVPPPVPDPAPETVQSPPVAAIEPQPAAPPAPPAAPAPAQASESLSRDQYRVQLIDEARRHKRYPPLARENNWQGDVRIGVVVAASGRASVMLMSSSGYQVLDRQALEMFTQAARAVPVPPPLRGKEFSLEVRAVYGLED
jgi:periplasmic protein TonB